MSKPKATNVPKVSAQRTSGTTPPSSPTQTSSSSAPLPRERPSTGTSFQRRNKKKNEYQRRSRVLLVGDSIAHNSQVRKIEVVTDTTIKTAKAYSSVFDQSARFKHQNINDVTKKELRDAPFDHVVLAAPTVDISNLNTENVKATDNVDGFKEKVRISCKNMMKTVQDALTNVPELKVVTIMNHSPRYDTSDVDPAGIKPILANFANAYFLELWLASPLKDKIIIGSHTLECSGDVKMRRYTDDRNRRYDGVHLYGSSGREAYTDSVINILFPSFQSQASAQNKRDDDHFSCPQTNYRKQQKMYSSVLKGQSGGKNTE